MKDKILKTSVTASCVVGLLTLKNLLTQKKNTLRTVAANTIVVTAGLITANLVNDNKSALTKPINSLVTADKLKDALGD